MRTWLRSVIDAIFGTRSGKTGRLDTATRMAMDADFGDRHVSVSPVRRIMRNLSPDDDEDDDEPLTGFITREEADEVEAEIARRVYAGFDTLIPRLAARAPHLTGEQLDAIELELQKALAPMGKRPGLN